MDIWKETRPWLSHWPGTAHVVGGALRDALLGRPLLDVDVSVPDDPAPLVKRLARREGWPCFPLDTERGVYRLLWGTSPRRTLDVSRYQGPTLAVDLDRRDFTVNALALPVTALGEDWRSSILDRHHGLEDLTRGRLKLIRSQALQEDPLRLLRAYRLMAELDFSIEAATRRELRRYAALIGSVSPERIREECLKLAATSHAAEALKALARDGLLTAVFPELKDLSRCGANFYGAGGVLRHSLEAVEMLEEVLASLDKLFPRLSGLLEKYLEEPMAGYPRRAHLKWAELFHDAGKPASQKRQGRQIVFHGHEKVGAELVTAAASRLRFSRGEQHSLRRWVGGHMRPGNLAHQPVLTPRAIYRFFRDFESDGPALLLMSLADHFTYLTPRQRSQGRDQVYRAVRTLLEGYFLRREIVRPPRLLNGHQLMRGLGLKPGPRVGELLEALGEAQSAGQVRTKKEALEWVKDLEKKTTAKSAARRLK